MRQMFEELNGKLKLGEVWFAYKKKNGDIRIALGTTNLDEIPEEDEPVGGESKDPYKAYYDLMKGEWRCFLPENLLWYEDCEESLVDESVLKEVLDFFEYCND